jgi:hypothetical protein
MTEQIEQAVIDDVVILGERIADADRRSAVLAGLETARDEAATLRATQSRIMRTRQADAVDAAARQRARGVVEHARPEIQSWRADFVEWVRQGWALVGRLREIEDPLYSALNDACAFAGQKFYAHDGHDGDANAMLDVHLAMDAALCSTGAVDESMWPLPPEPGNAFAQAVTVALGQFVGKVFMPRLRATQFQKRL